VRCGCRGVMSAPAFNYRGRAHHLTPEVRWGEVVGRIGGLR
jgi:hypothetical protein